MSKRRARECLWERGTCLTALNLNDPRIALNIRLIYLSKTEITSIMKLSLTSLRKSLHTLGPLLLLLLAYFAGQAAAYLSAGTASVATESAASASWGLSFQEEGKANASASYLSQYDAYYIEETEEKRIYLTFDCGFENGGTPAILDTLKKHNAPAAFFIVGNYLETSPELVKRMVDEGHTVGNHTYHHPDMSKISTEEAFSETNLQMAQDLGYQTFFWSLAYVDWYQDDQPTKEEAFAKLIPRIHPGAVVLLHNTSQTNAEILDELLTKWEELGYTFHPLSELRG